VLSSCSRCSDCSQARAVSWLAKRCTAWRGRHGHLSARGALAVLLLDLVGCVMVWLFVLGPVVALACSLAAFAVIWVSDWPPRRLTGEDRYVRIEELRNADDS
jgi:hypothetical protein